MEGISARRRRNQGRLRALEAMRATRSAQIQRSGAAAMVLDAGAKSGKRVIEAVGLEKSFDNTRVVRDFSLRIARRDRVAFVGPNGVGKNHVDRHADRANCPRRRKSDALHRDRDGGFRPKARGARRGRNALGKPHGRQGDAGLGQSRSGHGPRNPAPRRELLEGLFFSTKRRRAGQFGHCQVAKRPACCWQD